MDRAEEGLGLAVPESAEDGVAGVKRRGVALKEFGGFVDDERCGGVAPADARAVNLGRGEVDADDVSAARREIGGVVAGATAQLDDA